MKAVPSTQAVFVFIMVCNTFQTHLQLATACRTAWHSSPWKSYHRNGGRGATSLTSTSETNSLSYNPNRQYCRNFHSTLTAFRNRKKQSDDISQQDLSWEQFEFSGFPKRDRRFANDTDVVLLDHNMECTKEELLDKLHHQETVHDQTFQQNQIIHLAAWEQLDPDMVQRATEALHPFVNMDRIERIENVLTQRTGRTRFLFENPSNPSNVWACLRTIESFGIQHVDVILQSDHYKGKAALNQKRGMRTAVGSAQWLTVRNYASTSEAMDFLRAKYRILASDVNPNAHDIRTIPWDDPNDDRPICIVMGNEDRGISEEMRQFADGTFTLPMVGFAESFNLSVATAITCAHLSAASSTDRKSGQHHGPLRPGDLPEREQKCLRLKGLIHSLAQRRVVDAILKEAKVELPNELLRLL